MISSIRNYFGGIVFFSIIYFISKFSMFLSILLIILTFLILIVKKKRFHLKRKIEYDISEVEYKKEMNDKIVDGLSPFHMLLYMLITHIIWILIFIDNIKFFYFCIVLFILYSIIYYKTLSEEKNISIWKSIKNDLPDFALPDFALPDMNIFHIIVFIIIAGPFLFFIGSIIVKIIES